MPSIFLLWNPVGVPGVLGINDPACASRRWALLFNADGVVQTPVPCPEDKQRFLTPLFSQLKTSKFPNVEAMNGSQSPLLPLPWFEFESTETSPIRRSRVHEYATDTLCLQLQWCICGYAVGLSLALEFRTVK